MIILELVNINRLHRCKENCIYSKDGFCQLDYPQFGLTSFFERTYSCESRKEKD